MKLWQVEIVEAHTSRDRGKLVVFRYATLAESVEEAVRNVVAENAVAHDDMISVFPVEGRTVSMGTHHRYAGFVGEFHPEGTVTRSAMDFGVA